MRAGRACAPPTLQFHMSALSGTASIRYCFRFFYLSRRRTFFFNSLRFRCWFWFRCYLRLRNFLSLL